MFAHYNVKISRESNDISCCFSTNIMFIYTIYRREIINLIIFSNEICLFICKIMKYCYMKLTYNIIATNTINQNKNYNSLKHS